MPTSNMTAGQLYKTLQTKFLEIVEEHGMSAEEINIKSKALSAEEAIGITKRKDFPILTGKEIMLQTEYKGAVGQAFTDSPAVFIGTLNEVLHLDIENDAHARGLFVASLNAIMRYLSRVNNTVHCKNEDPERCAETYVQYIREAYGTPKIAVVGYQPAMIENLSKVFEIRALDLDPNNVGVVKYGTLIEDGVKAYEAVVINWAELVLCTGSTLCNGSIVNFIDIGKEVIFYGTTVAGAAELLGLKRVCFCSA